MGWSWSVCRTNAELSSSYHLKFIECVWGEVWGCIQKHCMLSRVLFDMRQFCLFFSSSQGYMYKIHMLTVTIFSSPSEKQQTRVRRWLPHEDRKLFLHHGCSFWPLHSPDATCSESCRNVILFKEHNLVEFDWNQARSLNITVI